MVVLMVGKKGPDLAYLMVALMDKQKAVLKGCWTETHLVALMVATLVGTMARLLVVRLVHH